MKREVSVILSLVLASSVIAETTNIESKGNLKSETKVELKEVSEITNKHNPVDIFKLVRLKIEQEKYDDAVIFLMSVQGQEGIPWSLFVGVSLLQHWTSCRTWKRFFSITFVQLLRNSSLLMFELDMANNILFTNQNF